MDDDFRDKKVKEMERQYLWGKKEKEENLTNKMEAFK